MFIVPQIDVTITDSGSPALNSSVSIRVNITTTNDIPPESSLSVIDGCEAVLPNEGRDLSLFDDATSRKKREVMEKKYIPKQKAMTALI